MQKYADPKNDIVFKKLFGEEKNKDLLIDFINKLLPHKKVKDLKDFSFAFIELPKFNLKDQVQESGIELWCDLFKYAKDRKDVTTTDPVITKAYSTRDE
jgi:predicted transposase/invertase (TIGR01784 family)